MQNLRKFLLFLFALALILITIPVQHSSAAVTKTIKVWAFNNYPVIFKDDDGVIKGFYVDLLTEIGEKENIKFEYVFGTWNEGLDNIKTSDVDLLTSVAYTKTLTIYGFR